MVDLVKSATISAQIDASKFEDGEKKIVQGATRIGEAAAKVEVSLQKMSGTTRYSADGFDKWMGRIDPATKAAQQHAAKIAELAYFQQAGTVSAEKLGAAHKVIEERFGGASNAATLFGGTMSVLKGTLAAIGIEATAQAVINFARESIAATAAIKNQAQAAGVSTTALQVYRLAGIETGTAMDTVDNAVRRFTRSMGEAATIQGPARAALTNLGFTARDLAGGPEALLPRVAQALLGTADATVRARIETQLFGRSGQENEAVLKKWAEGMDSLTDKYSAMGLIVEKTTIERLEKVEARFNLFWARMRAGVVDFFDIFAKLDEAASSDTVKAMNKRIAGGGFRLPSATVDEAGTPSYSGAALPQGGSGPAAAAESWTRAKTSLQLYIEKVDEEIRLDELSAAEKQRSAQFIAAAQAKETDLKALAVEQGRTYIAESVTTETQARLLLGEALSRELDIKLDVKDSNARLRQETDAVAASVRAATIRVDAYNKALEKQGESSLRSRVIADLPGLLKPTEIDIHRNVVLQNMTEQIQIQTDLAKLNTLEREKQVAILDIEFRGGQKLGDQERAYISLLVEQRHHAEDLRAFQDANQHSFESWLKQVETTGKLSFKSLFSSILSNWQDMLNKMITQWLAAQLDMTKSGGGGAGGILGAIGSAIFGGGFSGAAASAGAAGFSDLPIYAASGADVAAGQRVIVGETGVEEFRPKQSGSIVPVGSRGGTGGNVNITIDARGATPGMEQKLLDAAEVIAHRAIDVRSPSIVAASVRSIRISRRAQGLA